jgi:hypothetical protein
MKLNWYLKRTGYSGNCLWSVVEIVFGLFRLSRLIERTLNLALVSMGNSQILAQSHRLASSMTSFTPNVYIKSMPE